VTRSVSTQKSLPSSDFIVAYIPGNQILELPPSVDRKDDKVETDIDHFSRYAISW